MISLLMFIISTFYLDNMAKILVTFKTLLVVSKNGICHFL
jgi:hypothetical protein